MKRDKKFNLVNELSVAITEKTVFEHELGDERLEYLANTNTLKVNGETALNLNNNSQTEKNSETEEEIFAKIYAQRKTKQ